MELGTIKQINLETEMQASYLDYAMSVIVARALPDVRDGLKPVHRRILYAMNDLGIRPDQPYKKSARIVGEVLGKYHPHGDAAVYEAMVRMAQDFSLRYPLVDGQGNFGSIDGDNAAAMRYTEARLSKIAMEMLGDIDKDTVDWTDNFDGTLKEPVVLPAALPNLVVNGSSGIAVGMSTNIPPHNLGEVVDALCHLIDNYECREDVSTEDIMKFIPGPDFPTGGIIYRYSEQAGEDGEPEDVIAKAYAGGRGSITMQAKAHIEDMSRNRSRIIVTELPYQANKAALIERIAELVRDGRLEGITDLRDESDRTGMRVIIEMTRTVEPMKVLGDLYKLTPLQQTFGVSLLALVDGEPKLLSLKYMLLHFLDHRQKVIVRRTKHDLAKAKARAHILEGLLKALDILDEIITHIRGSRTAEIAREGLRKQFGFSDLQAQAILDMQLRRLAALERKKLQDEYKEVMALIKELEALLASPKKVLALIRQNLLDLKSTYGDPRRTQIADRAKGVLTTHDVVPEQNVTIALRADGMVIAVPDGNAAAKAGGPNQHLVQVVTASARDDLYLFTASGKVTRIGAHQPPQGGAHHANLGGFSRSERVVSMLALPKVNGEPLAGYLVLATAKGDVKRSALAEVGANAHNHPVVIRVADNDELIWAGTSEGGGEIMLFTAQGQAIRFKEDDVRSQGLAAGGMGGIRLKDGDRVVGAGVVPPGGDKLQVAAISAEGYARRSPLDEFPVQGRNGQGVQAKMQKSAGALANAALVEPEKAALAAALASGGTKRLPLASFAYGGRTAAGKAAVATVAGDTVLRLIVLPAGGAPEPAGGSKSKPPKDGNDGAAPKESTRGAKTKTPTAPPPPNKVTGKPTAEAKASKAKAVAAPAQHGAADKAAKSKARAGGEVKSGQPAAPAAQPVAPPAKTEPPKKPSPSLDIPNLFGPLPPRAAAARSELLEEDPVKPARPTRPRGTPEAGSVARPPGSGQLPLVGSESDEPKDKQKRGKKG